MKLEDLARKFMEKNPSLLRDIMESHFIRFKSLEIQDGKVKNAEIESKQYKDDR